MKLSKKIKLCGCLLMAVVITALITCAGVSKEPITDTSGNIATWKKDHPSISNDKRYTRLFESQSFTEQFIVADGPDAGHVITQTNLPGWYVLSQQSSALPINP